MAGLQGTFTVSCSICIPIIEGLVYKFQESLFIHRHGCPVISQEGNFVKNQRLGKHAGHGRTVPGTILVTRRPRLTGKGH